MAWPKGKPRPDKDKAAISKGKTGKARTPEEREAISEGRKRWWAQKKSEETKDQ